MPLSRANLEYAQAVVETHTGVRRDTISISRVNSRLVSYAARFRAASVNELIQKMRSGEIADAPQVLSEALIDRETFFFRDVQPFDALRQVILPQLKQKRSTTKQLIIGSFGCATGEEAYSLALTIQEWFPELASWSVQITGADISLPALRGAIDGRYNQLEINRGLPFKLLLRHFVKDASAWRVKEETRKLIQWVSLNFVGPWPAFPPFDLILCRHVCKYLTPEAQVEVAKRLAECLAPDGFLLFAPDENPPSGGPDFDVIKVDQTAFYQVRPPAAEAAAAPEVAEVGDTAESWLRLRALVTQRGALNPSPAAAIIAGDAGLRAGLLAAASHLGVATVSAPSELAGALAGVAKEKLLAVAMSVPLARAVIEGCGVILTGPIEQLPRSAFNPGALQQVVLESKFSGGIEGSFRLRLELEFALTLGAQILGVPTEDFSPDFLPEVFNSLGQIITQNLAAGFQKAGLTCLLSPPAISTQARVQPEENLPPGAVYLPLGLQYQGKPIGLDFILHAGAA